MAPTLESLPTDVRMEIMRLLVKGTDDIHPDPDDARAEHNMPTGKPTICTPILHTCKLLHADAVSVLYSENTFNFTEEPIGTTSVFPVSIKTALPRCDFTTMYAFLLAIGRCNRRRLRKLKMEFRAVSQFMDFRNELAYGTPAGFGGAPILAEAIELLARSHRLNIIEISRIPFQSHAFQNHPSFKLFYQKSALGVRIRLMKPIERLLCREVEEWALEPLGSSRRTQYDQYMLFKEEMESRYNC